MVLYLDSSETKRDGILYEIMPIIFIYLFDFFLQLLIHYWINSSFPEKSGGLNRGASASPLSEFRSSDNPIQTRGTDYAPWLLLVPPNLKTYLHLCYLCIKTRTRVQRGFHSIIVGWSHISVLWRCVLAHLSYWESVDKETDLRSSELLN